MASNDSVIQVFLIVIALILVLPVFMMALAWPMMGMWDGGHMWGCEDALEVITAAIDGWNQLNDT